MIGGCVDLESQASSQSFYRKIMVTFFLKIFIVFYMRGAIVTRVIVEFYRHSETLTSAILRIAVIDNYSMLKCRISSLNANDTFMIPTIGDMYNTILLKMLLIRVFLRPL